ncbi:MAG: ERCC4 domain-containing protein [Candidatus Bathyarchaeia archaeon]
MSGTETLVPYIKEPTKAEQPIIIIDSREATTAPKIVKALKEQGAKIEIKPLQKGDYIISDQCAFERKTVRDLVYTLTHRHLFDQLFTLKEAYERPFILIEGYLPVVYKFTRINPASIWGALFALAKQQILLIHTTNYKETTDFLYTAARQEQLIGQRKPAIHPIKKHETLADAQIFFIASLPNVGRERATSLLQTYQTPLNALLNIENWPKAVHGLGPKTTQKVKHVLHKPYKK